MSKKTRRLILWGAATVVAVVLWLLASRPDPAPVDLATVARRPLLVTLDQEARTRVRERFVLTAPSAGRLLRVELEPGDSVAPGEVVATFAPAAAPILDPRSRRTAEARLAAARAAWQGAIAEKNAAASANTRSTTELARLERLRSEGLLSVDALEAAQAGATRTRELLSAAQAAERVAIAEMNAAEAALAEGSADGVGSSTNGAQVTLRAPAGGVVLARHRESESVVAPGEPILEIGDLSDLEVIADYLSTDAVRIQPGTPVRIERWGGPAALLGRVRRVEPGGFIKISALGVEEQRVWVVVDLESPPDQRAGLGDGYRVETRVVLVDRNDVLTVPTGALVRAGGDWSVFVVEDGIAHQRSVTIGDRAPFDAEVLEGLAEGDQVVLHPTDRVADGVRVRERG